MALADTNDLQQHLLLFRRKLHQHPSLSGDEGETANLILDFLKETHPHKIITKIGGQGIAAVYEGEKEGPVVLLRAELDALPINEISNNEYPSQNKGISHKCGHDGHIAILCGVAKIIHEKGLPKGKVILHFQPEEETGTGAGKVILDQKFQELEPEFVFALHNLPGFPLHQVVVKEGVFTAASVGIIINLKGKTSHAAEPENGISPAAAVSRLIKAIENLPESINAADFCLATVVHVSVGHKAFGVTPGAATVMATLRSFDKDDFHKLKEKAKILAEEIADQHQLKVSIEFEENFDTTVNDPDCVKTIEAAAKELNLHIKNPQQPFRWSEDFGKFTQTYKGALFGLGAGDIPDLHNPDYDFPDELIQTGVNLFYEIISKKVNP